jgi:hypothetical protein
MQISNQRNTMKKKLMMMALVAGLLGSAGTVFAAGNDQPPQSEQPAPGMMRPEGGRCFDKDGRRQDFAMRGGQRMKQALGLSDSQEAKMAELRRSFFEESRPLRDSVRNLKHDLALESVKKSPDNKKIASIARKIGDENVRLAQLESRHLRELATVLDAQQIDRLIQMKQHFGGRHWNRG